MGTAEKIHLHKNVKILWFLPTGAAISFLFLLSIIIFFAMPDVSFIWITHSNYFYVLPIVVLAFWLLAYGWIGIVYDNFTYEFSENELIVHRGVFTRVSDTIPFSNIQDITSERSLGERFLGIATLLIETSGSSNLAGTDLPGIANKEEVIDSIMKRVKRSKNAMGAETRAQGADTSQLLTGILDELRAISSKLGIGLKNSDEKQNIGGKAGDKDKPGSLYDDYKDFKKK
ncbi:MAG: PH domain-containing protein [Candidatus Micrarchaeia archaeon]|jgi:uncharacterized membrane protein YdbT with pleckstrin-like domain